MAEQLFRMPRMAERYSALWPEVAAAMAEVACRLGAVPIIHSMLHWLAGGDRVRSLVRLGRSRLAARELAGRFHV